MRLTDGLGDLTYCTNIHPGESWPECASALARFAPSIKQAVCPNGPFGLGLRLSAQAAADLSIGDSLNRFRDFLAEQGLYVVTVNGFPYGAFHGTAVKTAVYRPDWRTEARLVYTGLLADLLAALLPEGGQASISTVPGGWADDLAEERAIDIVVTMLIRAVAGLDALHRRTGRVITLALEPEPGCLLDSSADAVPLFHRLRAAPALALLKRLTGVSGQEGEDILQRHLGLCLDLCHMAVCFEDPEAALALLRAEAIPIHKLQLSAGLRLAPEEANALRAFDDGVYLHQVACRRGETLLRFHDLDQALSSAEARAAEEWRVHFHVPLWAEQLDRMGTTADLTRSVLAAHAVRPIAPHLEVETYSWGVLPLAYRQEPPEQAIARELSWALRMLSREAA